MKEYQEQASRDFRNANGEISENTKTLLKIGAGIALIVIIYKMINKK
jgi:hypothetical protein